MPSGEQHPESVSSETLLVTHQPSSDTGQDSANRLVGKWPSCTCSGLWVTLNPGIDSSLSKVPPVCPRPRPLIMGTWWAGALRAAAQFPWQLCPLTPIGREGLGHNVLGEGEVPWGVHSAELGPKGRTWVL